MNVQGIAGELICVLLAGVIAATPCCFADNTAQARKLKAEAVKILQSGSALAVDPDTYADCVLKLEKAIQLLESGGARDENLLQGHIPYDSIPQVVGITVHLTFAKRAYEIARFYRERGSVIVLGGLPSYGSWVS